jgi:nicotinamide-nucleotide amidase
MAAYVKPRYSVNSPVRGEIRPMDAFAGYCIEQELVERAAPVVALLQDRHLSLVTAESCTGGLIAAILSQVPGAADVFHGAFVTYSKALKVVALDVSGSLLSERGGVNEEVALEMARGALRHSPAQLALSITGVLGPEPDEDGFPAGLIYVATASTDSVERVEAYRLSGFEPDQVRREAVEQAFKLLERAIAECPAGPSLAPFGLFGDRVAASERLSG